MAATEALPEFEYITVDEAADLMRCSAKTVRRRIARRELRSYKVGGKRLVRREDADAYIASGLEEAIDAWDL